jgi:hypothetical protein
VCFTYCDWLEFSNFAKKIVLGFTGSLQKPVSLESFAVHLLSERFGSSRPAILRAPHAAGHRHMQQEPMLEQGYIGRSASSLTASGAG